VKEHINKLINKTNRWR